MEFKINFKIVSLFVVLIFLTGCVSTDKKTNSTVDNPSKLLKKEIKEILQDNVFEVVMKKPVNDSLVYEKELPWDKIDFTYRNDKYESVGTAFLYPEPIFDEEEVFVTNLHNARYIYLDTISYPELYIRSQKDQKVYQIKNILGLGDTAYRDIIFFTINEKLNLKKRFPGIRKEFSINEYVVAVGNAYGQGIIERIGTLTNQVSEEKKGAWKWIITSADVSPGNSGGPLIDLEGNILGLVKAKKKDETNYNYSLPVSEFFNFTNKYYIDYILRYYGMQISDRVIDEIEIKVPDTIPNIRKVVSTKKNNIYRDNFLKILEDNKDNVFPNSKKSLELLYNTGWRRAYFPRFIVQDKNDNWYSFNVDKKNKKSVDLENNGYLERYESDFFNFFRLRIPDNYDLAEFLDDKELILKTFFQGFYHKRTFAGEDIQIESISSPCDFRIIKDTFGRIWIFAKWFIEIGDQYLYIIYTPDPKGIKGISKIVAVNNSRIFELDIEKAIDFFEISHYGTFRNWQDFLKLKEYLPDFLKTFTLDYKIEGTAEIKYKNFQLFIPEDFFDITDESDISMNFYHKVTENGLEMEIKRIIIGEHRKNRNSIFLIKEINPEPGKNTDSKTYWEKICLRKNPYDNKIRIVKGNTFIIDLTNNYKEIVGNDLKDDPILYWVEIEKEGSQEQDYMAKNLEKIINQIKILE